MPETTDKDVLVLVCVPWMHAELVTRPLPGEARFFDPGLAPRKTDEDAAKAMYRPASLPLDSKQAGRVLREMLAFGAQAARPADIAVFGAKPVEDFYTGTALDINSEFADLKRLEQGLEPAAPSQQSTEEREQVTAMAAQKALLLAWHAEEQLLELMRLQQGVGDRWRSFESSLGLDVEDPGDDAGEGLKDTVAQLRTLSQDWPVAPWSSVLPHMARLLPEHAALVCCDPAMVADLSDRGLVFSAPTEDAAPAMRVAEAASARVLRAPYWRMLGLEGPDKDRPWLDNEPLVLSFTGSATGEEAGS